MLEALQTGLQNLTSSAIGILALVWLFSVAAAVPFLLDLRLSARIKNALAALGRDRGSVLAQSRRAPRPRES